MCYEPEKCLRVRWEATPHFLPVCFEVDKRSAQIILESVFGSCLKVSIFLLGVPWLGQKFCINPNQSVRSKIRNIPSMLFHFQFWINVVANAGCLLCQANSAQLAKCEWSLALRGCVSRGASPPPHLLTSPTLPPARQLTCRAHGHLVIAMGIPTNRARSDFDISSSALHNFNLNSWTSICIQSNVQKDVKHKNKIVI